MRKISRTENLKVEYTDQRPGDIRDSFADISKAKSFLKFEPAYNIESGLKEYIEWSKSRNYAI